MSYWQNIGPSVATEEKGVIHVNHLEFHQPLCNIDSQNTFWSKGPAVMDAEASIIQQDNLEYENNFQNSICHDYWSMPTTKEECESLNELFISRVKHMYGIPPVSVLVTQNSKSEHPGVSK